MLSVSFIKFKLVTVLGMVFMGLFSRLILGMPALHSLSSPSFQNQTNGVHFPNGSRRSTLRFMTGCRAPQKRRRFHRGREILEEEMIPHQVQTEETFANYLDEAEISSRL